jgi:protein-L-isoaspartate(D-aspartate) O-methyltransferase
MITDDFKHKGLRAKMVEELRKQGIKSETVLQAINQIPRHLFIRDNAFLKFAYDANAAFPIENGQTISRPHTVAFQTELLEVKKGEKILEVGTGSGYQSAVLCQLGAKVFTIERQRELYEKAKALFDKLFVFPIRFFYGDGFEGVPAYAPYDKIIITCGAPFVPEKLLKQLKIGGKMVIPIGDGEVSVMTEVKKISETNYQTIEHGTFKFVPMLKQKT